MTGNTLYIKGARLAFTDHLFVPAAYKNDPTKPKKYSCKLLIPKTHPQIPQINEEIARLALLEWKDDAARALNEMKTENRLPLYDGDIKKYDGYQGHFFLSASNEAKPTFVRANPGTKEHPNFITDPNELYSGCYVISAVSFWTQPSKNGWGIRINTNLKGLQFYRPGEAFRGAGASSLDEFGSVEEETPGNVVGTSTLAAMLA